MNTSEVPHRGCFSGDNRAVGTFEIPREALLRWWHRFQRPTDDELALYGDTCASAFRVAVPCVILDVMAQDIDPPRPVIRFYSVNDDYGEFSNFARYSIRLKGKSWPTSEHYFQAQKFANARDQEEIRGASTPMLAAQWGRDRKRKLRRDWESAKLGVMREAVEAKFRQHEDLRTRLLATGDAKLVEHTENDAFWGDGGDGSGRNELGRILMAVRDRLRSEAG